MKGSEFLQQIKDVRQPQVSTLGLQRMLAGNMPGFILGKRYECTTDAVIDGLYYQCRYFTLPQYLSVGDDSDWVQFPLTILDLQKFCDAHMLTGADGSQSPAFYIPPKKLVKNTWGATDCKIEPQPLGATADMTWPVRIGIEQAKINAAMVAKGCPLNAFSRAKKAYITAPGMDGSVLHFTGWYRPNGWAWQDGGFSPVDSTGSHEATYADYSHGCDLVYHDVIVNGRQYDFAEVCAHPKLWVLVSDQGPFVPRFPNAGLSAKSPPAAPPASAPPANYQGDVFKTASNGALTLVKASTLSAGAGGAVEESTTSLVNVLLGIGATVAGYFLIKRWRHAH